ncbi:O-antigen ligase family protein [Leptospira sp. GIMC2001]|uniref:O-antigen ligase family protein n=1 Tax=Leptospira sp. GIMC2001 TaxID=1513297 RepID=UPI00234A1CD0|nr:O-antigen ligase family protein [Leptospira sp. GIMC2001]WCL48344.1 O-antigen ligase family protein [Leptospira sp. GIMC2001]
MKAFLIVALTLYLSFLSLLLFIDDSLPTSRINYISLSLFFLVVGYLIRNSKKEILDFIFYISGGFIIVFLSYSAITTFPSNNWMSRDFLRAIHYVCLFSYIVIFRKNTSNRYIFVSAWLLIIHSLIFHLNDHKGIYLFPFIIIAFMLQNLEDNRATKTRVTFPKVFSSLNILFFSCILFLLFIKTQNNSIYEYISFSFFFLILSSFHLFRHLEEHEKNFIFKTILIIMLFQLVVINYDNVHAMITSGTWRMLRKNILSFPTSAIGSISTLGISIAAGIFLYKRKLDAMSIGSVLIFICALFLIYFAHSRTSLIASFFAVSSISLFLFSKGQKKIFHNNIFRATVLLIGIIAYFTIAECSLDLETLNIRFSLWELHIKSVSFLSPIFGLGAEPEWRLIYQLPPNFSDKAFSDIYHFIHHFKSFPQAHSVYIQITSSFGIIGIGFLIFVLYHLIKNLIRIFRSSSINIYESVFISTTIGYGLHELTDFHIFDYPIIFPILSIIAFAIPSKHYQWNSKINYINASLIFIASLFIMITSIQISLIKIHKKDISPNYNQSNLTYFERNENERSDLIWTYPGLDFVFRSVPESNFHKLKFFFHRSQYEKYKDLQDLEKAVSHARKCIILNSAQPLCLRLLTSLYESEVDQDLTEFLNLISNIQDPFDTLKSLNFGTK